MGVIISRFRKKQTTVEILESIEKDISSLQKFRRQNQEKQKKLIASLLLYSILFYITGAVIFFFAYFPKEWTFRLLYSTPLLVFPLLIFGIKKLLHWYFVKRIANNDIALRELREKKKQMLEDVMEKETYKKAKEILEKFDPARFKQLEKPPTPTSAQPTPGSVLRQRTTQQRMPMPGSLTPQPLNTPGFSPRVPVTTPEAARIRGPTPQRLQMAAQNGRPLPMAYGTPPGPPLPRPLLPRERSHFDKLVEYLVGDGPQNRYALICRYCHSHNGMALKEEFEYLTFRCCYCYSMNPSRKKKPYAPKLEFPSPPSTPASSKKPQDPADTSKIKTNRPEHITSEGTNTVKKGEEDDDNEDDDGDLEDDDTADDEEVNDNDDQENETSADRENEVETLGVDACSEGNSVIGDVTEEDRDVTESSVENLERKLLQLEIPFADSEPSVLENNSVKEEEQKPAEITNNN